MKNLIPAFAAFIALVSVSIASQAESPNRDQKQSQAPWGRFQTLENPQIRLTFLIQSAYLESVEKEIDQAPRLARYLMDKTSIAASERKQAIKEYREWWLAKEAGHNSHLSVDPRDTQLSSGQLREFLENDIQSEPPSSARRKRMRFVQMTLKTGFSDFTLAGFKAIERLEAEKDLGSRLIGLTEALGHMAKDEARLEALASLSNLLLLISVNDDVSEANRKRLKPHAIALSKILDKAIRDANLIDVLNPANLIGGAVVFKTVGQLTLKSPMIMKALGQWSKTSTVTKATVASAAGHAAVLSSISQPNKAELNDTSNDALLRLKSGISGNSKSVLDLRPGSKNDSISLDAARVRAEELLYSETSFKSAWRYAELIGYGERLLLSPAIYRLSVNGLKTSDFIQKRDLVMLRFERYMAKRGLKVVDAEALAMLKAFVDEHIPKHQDGQPYTMVSSLLPALKGNCVSRTLALTALFYPAYLRYENPDLKFGIMLWEDHIEAVLFNVKSKSAMSIYSMTPIDLKTSPSVLSPRALAGAFLYRSMSPRLFGKQDGRDIDLYPRTRLLIAKSSAQPARGPSDLTAIERDRDPNPSPFITALYADQVLVGDRKPLLDERSATDSSSGGLRDVRDLMSALLKSPSVDELIAKSNQTIELRAQANRAAPQVPDPFTTPVSLNEIVRLGPSRSPTKLPVLFVRADEWFLTEPSSSFLRRRATPYKSASDIETVFRKEFKELQENSSWQRLANGDAKSIAEFTSSVDFQFELMDFTEIVSRFQGLGASRSELETRQYPFRFGVRDLLEVLGLTEEFANVRKTTESLLGSIVNDSSPNNLAQFLKSADGLKNSDRLRHIQALFVAQHVSGKSSQLTRLLGMLEIHVSPKQVQETKDLETSQAQTDWSKTKPMVVQLRPIEAKSSAASRSSARPETRLKLSLSAETVFLLIHYFHTDVPDWSGLVNQIAASEDDRNSVLKFSSKFFGWMPSIDVHGSWQNRLADRWVDLSQIVCVPPDSQDKDCVTLESIPPQQMCKQRAIVPQVVGWSTKVVAAPQANQSKSCELLFKISSELMFDEVLEKFDRPSL